MKKNNHKYTRLIPVFLFLLMFSISNVYSQDSSAEKKAKLAMNTFLDAEKNKMLENYSEAVKLYEKTLEIDDSYDPAMFQLAHLYIFQQKYKEALYWCEKAHQLDPNNKWYSLLLIDLYKNNYQLADAADVYKSLLKNNATNTEYLLKLADLQSVLGEIDKAIANIEKVEKLDGITEKTSLKKKNIYLQQKDFDQAMQVMIELSNAFPKDEKYCSMIAEMYMKNKQPEKALVWYQKVLEINPENPYIQITLADYYSKSGDLEKAYDYLKEGYANPHLDLDTKIQVLLNYFNASSTQKLMKPHAFELAEILVNTHPDEPKSHAIYGDLLFRDSLYTKAVVEFKKVITLDSTRYAVWEQLLYSLSMLNESQEMASYSERAIEQFPEMEFPYYVNAIANSQLGHTKKVIATLEKGLYFVSNDQLLEQFYMFLGDAYHENGQKEKAYEAYEKCLSLNPDNSFVLNNYAYYLSLENSNLKKAEKMASHAVKTDPNSNNLDTYGWVLFQLGKYKDAKKYILQAIESEGQASDVVLEHMGDVYYKLGDKKAAKSYWKKAKKAGGKREILLKKIKEDQWYEEN
jgi:tetratricopeptide (TPR) repeat protein